MNLFQGGVPTDVDVARIRSRWPKLKPGDVIGYDDVAQAIGVGVTSHRYRTVTMAWRRSHERATTEIIACDASMRAFVVLTASGRVSLVERKDKSIARANRKNLSRAATTNREGLTEIEERALDFVTLRGSAVLHALKSKELRALSAPKKLE